MFRKPTDFWLVHKRQVSFDIQAYLKHYFIKSGLTFHFFLLLSNPIARFSFGNRNLADNDKDGRLTADEFVIAMHCCDIVRSGQTLPTRLPDDWLKNNSQAPLGRANSLAKSTISPPKFPSLSPMMNDENHSPETIENERKNSIVTYEEKRQMNYEAGHKELERRRQVLREQEEREQREREERGIIDFRNICVIELFFKIVNVKWNYKNKKMNKNVGNNLNMNVN